MRDLGIYTYLLQCWQAEVIADREVMGRRGLMPHRKQTARNLTMQQPLWGIISCDGCEKSQGIPSTQIQLWFDIWMTGLTAWEGCFHFPLCLWRSGNGWKEWAEFLCSVVCTTLTGHLHLLLWRVLLALLTLQIAEGWNASPCNGRRLPREGGTFLYTYCTEFR